MRKIIQIAIILMSAIASGQDFNSVKTTVYKVETSSSIADPTAAQAVQDITYYDGLGRAIQNRAHRMSNSGKDVVTHIEYDAQGRQKSRFLPYISTSPSLQYDANASAETLAFYSSPTLARTGNPDFEANPHPYSETMFEASPLGRALKQSAPGVDWKLPASPVEPDHTVRMEYISNTATDNVRLYKVQTGTYSNGYFPSTLALQGFYSPGSLYKTVLKDENWTSGDAHTIQEFRNSQGQVLLKRTYGPSIVDGIMEESWHDTYFVYDQFGNVVFVLPPLSNGSGSIADLNGLCYQYRYDDRGRLVEKKQPGKDWEYLVYDNLDRIVATGPAFSPFTDLQATNSIGWLFNKYDRFGRSAYTGWMKGDVDSAQRNAIQAQRNAQTSNLSESKLSTGTTTVNGVAFPYTNQAWPNGTAWHVLAINYYDDYNFPGAPVSFPNILGQTVYYNQTVKPRGMKTGSWTRILETSSVSNGELSYSLFDAEGRLIRTRTSNFLGGFCQIDANIDFAGTVLYTVTEQRRLAQSASVTIREDFTYSEQGRLVSHTHKIDNAPSELLFHNTYDELGQLILKKVGGTDLTGSTPLQKINFSYNARGWLKEVNKTSSLIQSGDPADLFAFKISYNDPETAEPLFNGNITETFWKTGSDNKLRKHAYQFDSLGRLTATQYQKPGGLPVPNSYGESQSYDKNGNITKLQRFGEFDDAVTALMVDELDYAYEDNSNRLIKVTDHTNNPHGFADDSNGTNDTDDDYLYDANGNIKADFNRGVSITYNHLNFPVRMVFGNGNIVDYIYTAGGSKVRKTLSSGSNILKVQDYMDGFVYVGGILEAVPTAGGYAKHTAGSYNYAYNYTDHLGNVRLTYSKDPSTQAVKIMEENNYYSLGLKHRNYNMSERIYVKTGAGIIIDAPCSSCPIPYKYNYKFNGQELQEEERMEIYDMPLRDYDPAIGRWTGIDPVTNHGKSPYNGHDNNPAFWSDPSGGKVFFYKDAVSADGEHAGDFFEAIKSAMSGQPYSFSVLADDIYDLTHSINLDPLEITIWRKNWTGAGFLAQDWVYRKSGMYEYHFEEISKKRWKKLQRDLDHIGAIPVVGEPFDIASGIMSAIDGDFTGVALSALAAVPVAGHLGTVIKIQRHHVVPKAVFKEFKSDLGGLMKRDGIKNLVDLPVPFHLGGHEAYNKFVRKELNYMKENGIMSPASIEALDGQLRGMIDQGLKNYHKTGENLNTYFKQF